MSSNESFWQSLKRGLSKTSARLSEGIRNIFGGKADVDQSTLKALRDLLISTDMGPDVADFFTQKISTLKFTDSVAEEVRLKLASEIENFLQPRSAPITITHTPHIILLCGVNGSGKTTTVAKLAHKFMKKNMSVIIGACDTFRAAAVEQLNVWAERISCPIVTGTIGADAASVAYKTVERAVKEPFDVVIIDTAGRLHNHKNLMEELAKICRVIRRHDEKAPHDIILVLDATIGQNTFTQVEMFSSFVDVGGLILTKLDGTAKGGVVLRVSQKYNLMIHAIGTGEGIEDLEDFSATNFAKSLLEI
ncbi:signal recognition particle-docking protein FtsY [Anaplasma phagocytophilum]|uniref:Signal recognition particle-docking protein FtsY n=3 Tax=Anaplasma phagocytophilum TaxID=948 RepID=A0A0F3MU84_ANAPH|nr:signal recognition particle-docking protein FtsY [Anaplasma phagocytophilum]ABD43532.1 signal recognition particle-docking protein FtsY [Anaplasma phagocytophilum str. HZ]AGR79087.1 cell division protein FtsY [Anaplasma phagocytophilum str. HZ2]AGR81589.1 cell division protein FtsY [Anaplasma phagocytophilum str. Dog2]EOA61450.1 signal recognition particle-docking protein FtsY [Anaplasma phagocytophilum str. HGE1]KJV59338.1 signal recognition particle-docking protein FtsY [Anaplasma phagocy